MFPIQTVHVQNVLKLISMLSINLNNKIKLKIKEKRHIHSKNQPFLSTKNIKTILIQLKINKIIQK
jgi:hypothetical protein